MLLLLDAIILCLYFIIHLFFMPYILAYVPAWGYLIVCTECIETLIDHVMCTKKAYISSVAEF